MFLKKFIKIFNWLYSWTKILDLFILNVLTTAIVTKNKKHFTQRNVKKNKSDESRSLVKDLICVYYMFCLFMETGTDDQNESLGLFNSGLLWSYDISPFEPPLIRQGHEYP